MSRQLEQQSQATESNFSHYREGSFSLEKSLFFESVSFIFFSGRGGGGEIGNEQSFSQRICLSAE